MRVAPSVILKEIYSAVDKELKTIRRYGATSRIRLLSGIRCHMKSLKPILYRFEMVIQSNLPVESQGKLIVGGLSSDARVIKTEAQFIWLEVSQDFGERIPHAYFDVDLSFLLEDLRKKYAVLIDGQTKINQPGIDLLLANIPETAQKCIGYLSYEQLIAIEKIISLEIGAIHA